MKKIVRLTESDIVRLVKKVLNEDKKILNEDEKIANWVPVGLVNPETQGLISIDGVVWKAKLPNQNGNNEYLVVRGLWSSDGKICIGNDDWGKSFPYYSSWCFDYDDQQEFAGNWYNAKVGNYSKFTVKDGKLEFIREY